MDREELVGRLFRAYKARDLDEARKLVAPDVRIEPLSTALLPGRRPYEGIDGLGEWFGDLARSGYEFDAAIDSIEVQGDRALVAGALRTTSAHEWASSTSVAWVFEFDPEDRLHSMRAFLSLDEAREWMTS